MEDTLQIMVTEISRNNKNDKICDKGKMIVILSRTKLSLYFWRGEELYYYCNKRFIYQENQWYEYTKEMICIITINYDDTKLPARRVITQATYLYRICDVFIPQLNTGYIYILVYIKDINYTFIGKTMLIRNRIQQNYSGLRSVSTEPLHL